MSERHDSEEAFSMKVRSLILPVFAVVLLISTRALFCQTEEIPTRITDQNRTGDLPFSATIGSDIENVDIATGALHIRIPILLVKGRAGLDYDFHLSYDSNFWVLASRVDQFSDTYHQWTRDSGSSGAGIGVGWSQPWQSWTATTGTFSCMSQTETYISHLIFHDENNGKHAFASQKSIGGPCPMNDLSGPDLAAGGMLGKPGSSPVTGSGYDANGTALGGTEEDSNGNMMTWSWGGQDSLGRVLVTSQAVGNQRTYTVKDSNGNSQNYTATWNPSYLLKTNFPDEPGGSSIVLNEY